MWYSFTRRVQVLMGGFIVLFLLMVGRLWQLQVLQHDAYAAKADAQHERRFVLPAVRGQILTRKSRTSSELTPLATNNTLQMLTIDPLILNYPAYDARKPLDQQERSDIALVAKLLAPLLIHAHCEAAEGCNITTSPDDWDSPTAERIALYQRELEAKFREVEVVRSVVALDLAPSRLADIQQMGLQGVYIEGRNVVVDPTYLQNPERLAQQLSPIIGVEEDELQYMMRRRSKRYEVLMRQIVPEVSERIELLKQDPEYRTLLRGIVLQDEHWRYYPEKKLAGQVLGFVDKEGTGRYGIEERFDAILRGKDGQILGATNVSGQHLLGNRLEGTGMVQAQDGSDIVVTIDRVIQGTVEKLLEEDRKRFDADSAQAIVMDPQTGDILAMVNAPLFDPNSFGDAFLTYPITAEQEDTDRENPLFNQAIPTVTDDGLYYRYVNTWGPQVFRNRTVADIYEPGSVMKAVTMASALDADEGIPTTTYDDTGPVEVDEFTIRNADGVYAGRTSMISVINRSLNTGIAFVTQKMGRQVLYEYFKSFGFGEYTDIALPGENPSKLEIWHDWTASELVTRGFGQGIAVTPIQMLTAFAALANGGYLVEPRIVERIIHSDGTEEDFPPVLRHRVIRKESYEMIKAMLAESVAKGYASAAKLPHHTVMGKTGTSQTYDAAGRAQEEIGTTIATFAGYAPYENPAFVVLVKMDFPKASQWGSETAAVTFKRIGEFLVEYLDIPPDR
ncbi:penicillin-binding protein 2 [Candidatus Peribacteria bacterium]|nr:penicillin-binding protein 2 [Candidatus Peribacteria bacterium]